MPSFWMNGGHCMYLVDPCVDLVDLIPQGFRVQLHLVGSESCKLCFKHSQDLRGLVAHDSLRLFVKENWNRLFGRPLAFVPGIDGVGKQVREGPSKRGQRGLNKSVFYASMKLLKVERKQTQERKKDKE